MSEKREFIGAFIPAHIWVSKELIPAEKMILGEIDCLSKKYGYCDASRAHFAEWLSCTDQNVTYYFSKLERLGFIQIEKIPGKRSRIRLINARFYENQGVNGTDGRGKGGLPVGVNGTDGRGKGGLPEIQEEKQDQIKVKENSAAEKTAASLPENPALEANPLKKEKPPVAQPPLDLSGCYKHFSDPVKIRVLWERWMKYRKDLKKPLKTEDTIITALRSLYKWSEGNVVTATEIVEKSIGNQWQGLIKPEPSRQATPNTPQPYKLEPVPERTSAPAYTP